MLADNLLHFARILRQAGLPIGPDRVVGALQALDTLGLAQRDDVRAALAATLLDRHEHQGIFDLAFDTFWRDPKLLEQLMFALLPKVSGRGQTPSQSRPKRLQEALQPARTPPKPVAVQAARDDEIKFDATLSFSDRERLQSMDFESMTVDEFKQAEALVRALPHPAAPVRLRRFDHATRGQPDLRRTMRQMARTPDTWVPSFHRPRLSPPPLVVLLDVSGSMDRYARIFLVYVHALMQRHRQVHMLCFGTRLSNVTRSLRQRDVDEALRHAGLHVQDWQGGTRIASALHRFNQDWARRLLSGRATVLLVTDGLDRDTQGELGLEAARLRRLAHRLVWLNPLLRYEGFEPKAAGIRALLGNVDEFRPMHNLQSLADLARALPH